MAEQDNSHLDTFDQAQYNKAAIATAERITAEREAPPVPLKKRDLPDLFPAFNRTGLGVALEYQIMDNQPVSAALQQQADNLGATFEHLGLTLGTVIHNVDLKNLTAALAQFVRETLLERKVVFFRDQHLSEEQQVSFARCFGELDAFPFGKPGQNPYILQIIHDENRPGTENSWHTDVTWMKRPSLGSIAQLMEGPAVGGDTLFADSHACYLGLTSEMQNKLQHMSAVHDYRIFLTGRGNDAMSDELIDSIKQAVPFGVTHPLLRTHPETGKTALYIHGGFIRHESLFDSRTNEPLGMEESQAIVKELLTQHGRPEYVCRFKWETGSIAFWDNRAVQHYAASDYWPHRRVLRRVTVSGDEPYFTPTA